MHLLVWFWFCKSTLGQRWVHFRPELNLVRCSARRLVSYPTHSFASQCCILITRCTHRRIRSGRIIFIICRIIDKPIVLFFDISFEFEAMFLGPQTQVLAYECFETTPGFCSEVYVCPSDIRGVFLIANVRSGSGAVTP
uniref:Secreted protein n=1 Tax=Cacopsylla melanoneura TaxID=428564 RepID=A0A8D8M2Y0_9HEMI